MVQVLWKLQTCRSRRNLKMFCSLHVFVFVQCHDVMYAMHVCIYEFGKCCQLCYFISGITLSLSCFEGLKLQLCECRMFFFFFLFCPFFFVVHITVLPEFVAFFFVAMSHTGFDDWAISSRTDTGMKRMKRNDVEANISNAVVNGLLFSCCHILHQFFRYCTMCVLSFSVASKVFCATLFGLVLFYFLLHSGTLGLLKWENGNGWRNQTKKKFSSIFFMVF